MIYLILGLLTLYCAWQVKQSEWAKTDNMGKLACHFLVVIGGLFILNWCYIYLVLPWEIGKFYNGGAGLTFTAMQNGTAHNLTAFNTTDESILWYNSNVHNDWVLLTNIMSGVELLMMGLIGASAFWWMYVHNIMGKIVKR